MAKDKGKGEETKPSSKTKDVAKAQDGKVKTKEAEAKDVLAFQPSKKEDPPSPSKAQSKCRSHQIFGATKFGFQPISCVHKCKNNPRLIEQINKNKDRQAFCFLALIAEHLVIRRKMIDRSPIL